MVVNSYDFKTNESITDQGWKVHFTSMPIGISENVVAQNLSIYPNPTNGTFTIEGIYEKINVKVNNAFGREVYQNEPNLPAKVDLSSQPKGIYFIKVETDNNTFFKKLVIN